MAKLSVYGYQDSYGPGRKPKNWEPLVRLICKAHSITFHPDLAHEIIGAILLAARHARRQELEPYDYEAKIEIGGDPE